MTSAFHDAAEKLRQQQQSTAPTSGAPAGSSLTEDSEDGQSSLFGGEKLPSLFNKFVMPGQERTGVITKPPRDVHSRNLNGEPKFWDAETKSVVTHDTGRPLKDTVVVLQTDYRFTEQEIADRGIDPVDVEDDNGVRGVFLNGDLKKAVMAEIKRNRIRRESEMVGMRLTLNRGRKEKIPGTNKDKWVGGTAKLERA